MNESEILVNTIISAVQDKKGKRIVKSDLTSIGDTICSYLVVCEGNTPTQVSAIADAIEEKVNQQWSIKPIGKEGVNNSFWVVIDYGDVMAHVFVPDAREFYDLDNFWEDARLTEIPDEW